MENARNFGSLDIAALKVGAADFRYLLDRGYPREPSLELVGTRYTMDRLHRHILHRTVFSSTICRQRKAHWICPDMLRGTALAVDGYNVLITVESSLKGIPVVLSDDGWVRDVAGVSGGYRFGEAGMKALSLILSALRALGPRRVLFLFDSPIARSGELASLVRNEMLRCELDGDAQAAPVPEKLFHVHDGPIATSDSALIDRLSQVVDLAGHVIRGSKECGELLDLG